MGRNRSPRQDRAPAKTSQAYLDAQIVLADKLAKRAKIAYDVWRPLIKFMRPEVAAGLTGKLGFFFNAPSAITRLGEVTLMALRFVGGTSEHSNVFKAIHVVGLKPKYEPHAGGGSIVYETKLAHDLLRLPFGGHPQAMDVSRKPNGQNGGHLEWAELALSLVSRISCSTKPVDSLKQLPILPRVLVATERKPEAPDGAEDWDTMLYAPGANGNTTGKWLSFYSAYAGNLPARSVLYEDYTDLIDWTAEPTMPKLTIIQDTGRLSFESSLYEDNQLLDISGGRFLAEPVEELTFLDKAIPVMT